MAISSNKSNGSWGELLDWPLIALHSIVTQDGKILTFGTDSKGMQGGQFVYDVYDPITGVHYTLENTTPTDIFCSAAIIIPGTDQILIGGGDARPLGAGNRGVNDVNVFNSSDLSLTASEVGDMNFARWYPTMISLSSGQTVILGGSDINGKGISIPEIFTPGEGWRKLDGATDTDLAASNAYARSWVSNSGEIIYFASGKGNTGAIEVRSLDPSGNGSISTIGQLPFNTSGDSPAIMHEAGHILIMATNCDLWMMDITGPSPVFAKTQGLSQDRNWADMTVLADGTVLINGGTSNGNKEAGADHTAAIWNPDTGKISYGADEAQSRLYHSTSVLLTDGSILSLGGGSSGSSEVNYLDGQVYKPPYLFNDDGTLADRPVISGVPDKLIPGSTFTITVDDASSISKMTFVKNGAATHSFNMEARMLDLEFKIGANNTIEITLPENANEVTAGSWMLFAWDNDGVPANAAIIAIEPTQALHDGIGELTVEYFTVDASISGLSQVNFDGEAIHTERASEIDESGSDAFYDGGPTDNFAARYTGEFNTIRDGQYTFNLNSDDGSRLFIDGQQIIDNDGLHGIVEKTATATLDAGIHKIELIYFERGGGAVVDLDWSGPGFARKQMTFDGLEENLLVNGGLELAEVNVFKIADKLPGWVSSTDRFELRDGNGRGDFKPTSGSTYVEIDGVNGELSQAVQTVKDLKYELSFDLGADPHHANTSETEVLWNGTVIATINPQGKPANRYEYTVEGTGGKDVLSFRALNGGNQDYDGAMLDSVVLKLADGQTTPVDPDIILGTTGDDYLEGTDGDDHFKAGDGNDVMIGGKGDDIFDGEGGDYNQVDFLGNSADYTFTRNEDGSVTTVHAVYGTDILINIDGAWFIGDSKWFPLDDLIDGSDENGKTITGTDGDDYLVGTDGDDTIKGGDGLDIIFAGAGDDIIDGEGGDYNQVDLLGKSTDHTFSKNEDGTITAVHAEYGTKTLSNIDGVWFIGDEKWSPIDDLLPDTDVGKTIIGTAGDDYLIGTNGDDTIKGGGGVDVIFAGAGDDIIDGEGGDYNQVDLLGNSTDYTFTQNEDGTVTATHAEYGTKTLSNIDAAWFIGDEKWSAIEDLVPASEVVGKTFTGTDGNDYLTGTAGDDIFLGGDGNDVFYGGKGDDSYDGQGGDYNQVDFSGKLADYTFTKNDDGTITAEHAEYGKDILKEIDGVWFDGDNKWHDIDDIVA